MPYLKLVLLSLLALSTRAQQKYWIEKACVDQNPTILTEISPIYCSEWIDACSYSLTAKQLKQLREIGVCMYPVQTFLYKNQKTNPRLGFALEQINGNVMPAAGLNGSGVKIGVIDGGFGNLAESPSLHHLLKNNQIVAYKNFFNEGERLVETNQRDTHGTEVVQLIAGINKEKNVLYGLATKAKYYLAQTDMSSIERRIEEDHLIAAMEWMHREGVQIINISLGYSRGFDDRLENYKPEQMDGKTTAVAKAVEYASLEKGILVVVAAGNEANNLGWGVVSTPADAQHALTVGSSKFINWEQTRFSSIGPEFVDFVKPDVLVFSGSGTSYSAPIITGMAACIKQYDNSLSNLDIIDIIQKAGHLYPYPNNYMGYGVPTCDRVMQILHDSVSTILRPKFVKVNGKKAKIDLENVEENVILLHTSESHKVLYRENKKPRKENIKIKRYRQAERTTVLYRDRAIEMEWQ